MADVSMLVHARAKTKVRHPPDTHVSGKQDA
jgi:hypothetical protein